MNKTVTLVLRIILGAALLFFGSNKLVPFMDPGMPEGAAAQAYMTGLMGAKVMLLVGIVEVLTALALFFNKYAALMLFIMMSVSVNMVLYHLTLDVANIGPAAIVLILNIVLIYAHKEKYQTLLS